MFRTILALPITFWLLAPAVAEDKRALPSGKTVIERIIANRSAIRSGRIHLELDVLLEKGDDIWKSRNHVFDIVFSGRSRRIDVANSGTTVDGVKSTSTSQAIIRADGTYILRPEDDRHFVDINSIREQRSAIETRDLDPLVVGLFAHRLRVLWKFGVGDVADNFSHSPIKVEKTIRDTRTVLKLSSRWEGLDGKPRNSVMFVDPSRGYSIEEIHIEGPNSVYSATIENKEWTKGTWYPGRIKQQQVVKNHGPAHEELIRVTSATFGADVPQREFSLEAIRLTVGRQVRKGWKHYLWDGSTLVPDPGDKPPQNSVGPDGASNGTGFRKWLLFGSAILLAGIAGFILVRQLRRKAILRHDHR